MTIEVNKGLYLAFNYIIVIRYFDGIRRLMSIFPNTDNNKVIGIADLFFELIIVHIGYPFRKSFKF